MFGEFDKANRDSYSKDYLQGRSLGFSDALHVIFNAVYRLHEERELLPEGSPLLGVLNEKIQMLGELYKAVDSER